MSPSRRQFLTATLAVGAVGAAGCVGSDDSPDGESTEEEDDGTNETDSQDGEELHTSYDTTEITVESDGTELGSVTAAIADTPDLRFTGLSDTESLPEDRGMLFVFDTADTRPFVMREMDFAIDMIYADVDGTITDIFHAPEPGPDEDGEDQKYEGFGQYVLEVNDNWTTDRGIETGDQLVFEL